MVQFCGLHVLLLTSYLQVMFLSALMNCSIFSFFLSNLYKLCNFVVPHIL
uniref:Uncharacterized protein n=1 Tax=Anguilla anguilla TaxID=7936 RepID=A0A0E9WRN8_ANGAN